MSVGSQDDFLARLQRLIPNGWFAVGAAPLRDGLLTGIANTLAFVYSILAYLRLQTRISTATDGFLDLIAADFFGNTLFRANSQSDPSFRARIIASILRERGTRSGVQSILTQLTGRVPIIFEPQRPSDTGVYGGPGLAYGLVGGYGSVLLPYQSFVIAFRPAGQGIPNIMGYGIPVGAYSTPSQIEYASLSMINGVNDNDLYAAINSVRPAGYTIWASISS
ncbi:MAG: hypothetical protein JWO52_4031 [Gammaproteobacteria bacterium]|nr:hypothetical protein [Gammaproteobacteria bacterium]